MICFSWFQRHLTRLTSVYGHVFFHELMVFDGSQTPAGVSVVRARASAAPNLFFFSCVVWPHGETASVMWTLGRPARALPNGFVLCSGPTWYFPKPSIYCWSPVQVINGLTELRVSVTKKGHILWAEWPKQSMKQRRCSWLKSRRFSSARRYSHNQQQLWFILIYSDCTWWLCHEWWQSILRASLYTDGRDGPQK